MGSTRNYFFTARIDRGTFFFVYLTIGHVISCVFPYCLVEKEHVQWLSVFVCLLVNKIEKLGSPFYAWFPTFSSRIFTILLFFFLSCCRTEELILHISGNSAGVLLTNIYYKYLGILIFHFGFLKLITRYEDYSPWNIILIHQFHTLILYIVVYRYLWKQSIENRS